VKDYVPHLAYSFPAMTSLHIASSIRHRHLERMVSAARRIQSRISHHSSRGLHGILSFEKKLLQIQTRKSFALFWPIKLIYISSRPRKQGYRLKKNWTTYSDPIASWHGLAGILSPPRCLGCTISIARQVNVLLKASAFPSSIDMDSLKRYQALSSAIGVDPANSRNGR
jgi:hypothetical protein